MFILLSGSLKQVCLICSENMTLMQLFFKLFCEDVDIFIWSVGPFLSWDRFKLREKKIFFCCLHFFVFHFNVFAFFTQK